MVSGHSLVELRTSSHSGKTQRGSHDTSIYAKCRIYTGSMYMQNMPVTRKSDREGAKVVPVPLGLGELFPAEEEKEPSTAMD